MSVTGKGTIKGTIKRTIKGTIKGTIKATIKGTIKGTIPHTLHTLKYIFLSNRPGLSSAGSSKSGRFVAPMMKTPAAVVAGTAETDPLVL
jgi:hypothetical protein